MLFIIQSIVLDKKTADLLDKFVIELEANPSEVITRAIRFLAQAQAILPKQNGKKKGKAK